MILRAISMFIMLTMVAAISAAISAIVGSASGMAARSVSKMMKMKDIHKKKMEEKCEGLEHQHHH
ncbi:MAG: hypothetical protein GX369_00035 [Euryarchaeota archaeon]|nr:hypothetical protein [Euryarchaeota archaeon]